MVTVKDDNTKSTYVPTIEEQKEYWDTRWGKNANPNDWQLRRGETIIELIRSLPLNRPKILDFGCATGWFTEKLSQFGDVTGIDLSEHAISIAKTRYPHLNFIAGNVFEMSMEKESFDVVIAQEVVAHVEDQVRFIDILSGITKSKGYLVITSANKIVMDRVDSGPDPNKHIKKWLGMKDLKRIIRSHYRVLRATTIIPMGDRGFLRLVNSHKINTAIGWFISRKHIEALKERLGLGYSLVILSKKKD